MIFGIVLFVIAAVVVWFCVDPDFPSYAYDAVAFVKKLLIKE